MQTNCAKESPSKLQQQRTNFHLGNPRRNSLPTQLRLRDCEKQKHLPEIVMASAIYFTLLLPIIFLCATIISAAPSPRAVDGHCTIPDTPENGKVDTIYNKGIEQLAVYSCEPGYAVIGSNTMICEDGRWDRKRHPTCTPVDCGAPEAITNGKVTYSTTEYRAKSQYNCDACYKLEGVATRTCKQSGIWSKENPKCAREECKKVEMAEGMYTNSRNPPLCGESVTVGCKSGYKLEGASTVVCLQGGAFIWLGAVGNCVKV